VKRKNVEFLIKIAQKRGNSMKMSSKSVNRRLNLRLRYARNKMRLISKSLKRRTTKLKTRSLLRKRFCKSSRDLCKRKNTD
jgi:hypothetical protein